MEVLIVSKTHMANAACVGGLVLENNRYIRLLNPGDQNQPADTPFNVGDVFDLSFTNRLTIQPPHIEDVIVTRQRFVRTIDDMASFIRERDLVDWNGHINNLFDGLLDWTQNGSGYIPAAGEMPQQSVGFWIADRNLECAPFNGKVRYRYPNGHNFRSVTYVGYQDRLETIPAGTILRVSLSRIFPRGDSDINVPRGYYLQLSGWYLEDYGYYSGSTAYEGDDLPF